VKLLGVHPEEKILTIKQAPKVEFIFGHGMFRFLSRAKPRLFGGSRRITVKTEA
jgi:hypothetical protein